MQKIVRLICINIWSLYSSLLFCQVHSAPTLTIEKMEHIERNWRSSALPLWQSYLESTDFLDEIKALDSDYIQRSSDLLLTKSDKLASAKIDKFLDELPKELICLENVPYEERITKRTEWLIWEKSFDPCVIKELLKQKKCMIELTQGVNPPRSCGALDKVSFPRNLRAISQNSTTLLGLATLQNGETDKTILAKKDESFFDGAILSTVSFLKSSDKTDNLGQKIYFIEKAIENFNSTINTFTVEKEGRRVLLIDENSLFRISFIKELSLQLTEKYIALKRTEIAQKKELVSPRIEISPEMKRVIDEIKEIDQFTEKQINKRDQTQKNPNYKNLSDEKIEKFDLSHNPRANLEQLLKDFLVKEPQNRQVVDLLSFKQHLNDSSLRFSVHQILASDKISALPLKSINKVIDIFSRGNPLLSDLLSSTPRGFIDFEKASDFVKLYSSFLSEGQGLGDHLQLKKTILRILQSSKTFNRYEKDLLKEILGHLFTVAFQIKIWRINSIGQDSLDETYLKSLESTFETKISENIEEFISPSIGAGDLEETLASDLGKDFRERSKEEKEATLNALFKEPNLAFFFKENGFSITLLSSIKKTKKLRPLLQALKLFHPALENKQQLFSGLDLALFSGAFKYREEVKPLINEILSQAGYPLIEISSNEKIEGPSTEHFLKRKILKSISAILKNIENVKDLDTYQKTKISVLAKVLTNADLKDIDIDSFYGSLEAFQKDFDEGAKILLSQTLSDLDLTSLKKHLSPIESYILTMLSPARKKIDSDINKRVASKAFVHENSSFFQNEEFRGLGETFLSENSLGQLPLSYVFLRLNDKPFNFEKVLEDYLALPIKKNSNYIGDTRPESAEQVRFPWGLPFKELAIRPVDIFDSNKDLFEQPGKYFDLLEKKLRYGLKFNYPDFGGMYVDIKIQPGLVDKFTPLWRDRTGRDSNGNVMIPISDEVAKIEREGTRLLKRTITPDNFISYSPLILLGLKGKALFTNNHPVGIFEISNQIRETSSFPKDVSVYDFSKTAKDRSLNKMLNIPLGLQEDLTYLPKKLEFPDAATREKYRKEFSGWIFPIDLNPHLSEVRWALQLFLLKTKNDRRSQERSDANPFVVLKEKLVELAKSDDGIPKRNIGGFKRSLRLISETLSPNIYVAKALKVYLEHYFLYSKALIQTSLDEKSDYHSETEDPNHYFKKSLDTKLSQCAVSNALFQQILKSLDIPARPVSGFFISKALFSDDYKIGENTYRIKLLDFGHAWTEVLGEDDRWYEMDATPVEEIALKKSNFNAQPIGRTEDSHVKKWKKALNASLSSNFEDLFDRMEESVEGLPALRPETYIRLLTEIGVEDFDKYNMSLLLLLRPATAPDATFRDSFIGANPGKVLYQESNRDVIKERVKILQLIFGQESTLSSLFENGQDARNRKELRREIYYRSQALRLQIPEDIFEFLASDMLVIDDKEQGIASFDNAFYIKQWYWSALNGKLSFATRLAKEVDQRGLKLSFAEIMALTGNLDEDILSNRDFSRLVERSLEAFKLRDGSPKEKRVFHELRRYGSIRLPDDPVFTKIIVHRLSKMKNTLAYDQISDFLISNFEKVMNSPEGFDGVEHEIFLLSMHLKNIEKQTDLFPKLVRMLLDDTIFRRLKDEEPEITEENSSLRVYYPKIRGNGRLEIAEEIESLFDPDYMGSDFSKAFSQEVAKYLGFSRFGLRKLQGDRYSDSSSSLQIKSADLLNRILGAEIINGTMKIALPFESAEILVSGNSEEQANGEPGVIFRKSVNFKDEDISTPKQKTLEINRKLFEELQHEKVQDLMVSNYACKDNLADLPSRLSLLSAEISALQEMAPIERQATCLNTSYLLNDVNQIYKTSGNEKLVKDLGAIYVENNLIPEDQLAGLDSSEVLSELGDILTEIIFEFQSTCFSILQLELQKAQLTTKQRKNILTSLLVALEFSAVAGRQTDIDEINQYIKLAHSLPREDVQREASLFSSVFSFVREGLSTMNNSQLSGREKDYLQSWTNLIRQGDLTKAERWKELISFSKKSIEVRQSSKADEVLFAFADEFTRNLTPEQILGYTDYLLSLEQTAYGKVDYSRVENVIDQLLLRIPFEKAEPVKDLPRAIRYSKALESMSSIQFEEREIFFNAISRSVHFLSDTKKPFNILLEELKANPNLDEWELSEREKKSLRELIQKSLKEMGDTDYWVSDGRESSQSPESRILANQLLNRLDIEPIGSEKPDW